MATTPNFAIPYPVDTDLVIDGDNAMRAIAERVDAILTASLLNSGPSGRRNVIRNGDMGVAQRGLGPFGSTAYTLDGCLQTVANATVATTRVAALPGAGMGLNGARYALQSVVTPVSIPANAVLWQFPVEDVRTLAGKQVTVSFVATAASVQPKIGVEVTQAFGTGGAPSATVNTAIGAVTVNNGTFTRYSLTFTMPSVAGKVLGTSGTDCVIVNLWLSAGSDNAARSSNIGIQGNTFTVTDVQLEVGATATPFERLSQQAQLSWCQRYYYRKTAPGGTANSRFCSAVSTGTALFHAHMPLPVTMRAVPTCAVNAVGNFLVYNGAGVQPTTGVTFNAAEHTLDSVSFQGSLATGLSGAGAYYEFCQNGAVAAYIEASAEL